MDPSWHTACPPDRAAIIMGTSGERVTYRELDDRSIRFARVLRARGLAVGDNVAILMENNRRYLEVAWAAQRAGLYYTAINTHLTPGEVQYILDDCGASALVSSETMASVVGGLELARIPTRVSAGGHVDGFDHYDDLIAEVDDAALADECEGREMLYSSGTTGRPKGIRKDLAASPMGHPTAGPVLIAEGLRVRGLGPDTVYLSPAPLYHSAPLVTSMSVQRLGATVVVMEHFDARECLELIERHRVTAAQFVPTMFVRMLRLPQEVRDRYDVSSLRYVLHAAAPCPVAVKQQMIDWWGPIVDEYYSGTEDIGGTYITAEEWLAHPGSVGLPTSVCHIVGSDGEELPPGEPGLVYFAGGRSMEYHNDPEQTAAATHERGWRTLGDIGYLDGDGYLYLTDRRAHMIISGGVNIYPQEAENVLVSQPEVLDVAVIGVPDPEMGEAVKAVVVPVDPAAAGAALAAQLIAACRAELAGYKCPRSVDFVDALPRDESGKLYKRRLREQYWEGRDGVI